MFYRLEAPPNFSKELRRVDLNSRLTEDSIKRISAALFCNDTVTSLSLNNANVAASNIGHIASMLTQNGALEVLFLQNNNIDARAAAILFGALAKNKTLHTLNLGTDDHMLAWVQTHIWHALHVLHTMATLHHTGMMHVQTHISAHVHHIYRHREQPATP